MRFIIVLFLVVPFLSAQTDSISTKIQKIMLNSGNQYIGYVLQDDSTNIVLRTLDSVQVSIPKQNIKTTAFLEGDVDETMFYFRDRNDNRLYFAQTGRTVKSGEVTFSVMEIFFPMLNVGVTDFISLYGGFSLLPSMHSQLYYFGPKVRIAHYEKLSLAANAFYMNSTNSSHSGSGITYLSLTGDFTKASFTFGFGYGFNEKHFSDSPFVMLGVEIRTGEKSKFITENWITNQDFANLYSFGFRTFSNKLSWDFGLIIPAIDSLAGIFPWVGITYNFY